MGDAEDMPTFEMRCPAHGAYESTTKACPHGCPRQWQRQEIRTPVALRRSGNMKFVDEQLKGIAADAGLSDLRHNGEGTSVLETMKKAPSNEQARWVDVPHAAAGFSREKGAPIPKIDGAKFGTIASPVSKFFDNPPPPPTPNYQGRARD